MDIYNETLSMIRGDSESITVACYDDQGIIIPLVSGDTIYFTVKSDVTTTTKAIQKVITTFSPDGKAAISIEPQDTKNLSFKTYFYDVQLTKANGEVRTLIAPSKFIVKSEVTYE